MKANQARKLVKQVDRISKIQKLINAEVLYYKENKNKYQNLSSGSSPEWVAKHNMIVAAMRLRQYKKQYQYLQRGIAYIKKEINYHGKVVKFCLASIPDPNKVITVSNNIRTE